MKAFTFAPHAFATEFKERGYVLVKGGVTEELLTFAKAQLAQCLSSGQNELASKEIKNKKKQYLFKLPEDDEFLPQLTSAIGTLTGLPVAQMTLSERHIKVYDDNASSLPPLHKDCVASQVAIGVPLEQSIDARLVLLPHAARSINPLDNAIYGARPQEGFARSEQRWSLEASECPEAEGSGSMRLVELDVQPSDVVIFAGSSIYHERLYGAKSAVLYLKLNAMRLDHLREDPSTMLQRSHGLNILQQKGDEQLLESVVELSPQLRRVSRHYTRLDWTTVLQAYVSGETEFTISEDDLRFVFALRGRRTVRDVLVGLGISEDQLLSNVPRIRRLAQLGGLDVLG